MPKHNDKSTAVLNLLNGSTPGNPDVIKKMTVGISFLTDFWCKYYLDEYIRHGGSKIKFLTGSSRQWKNTLP